MIYNEFWLVFNTENETFLKCDLKLPLEPPNEYYTPVWVENYREATQFATREDARIYYNRHKGECGTRAIVSGSIEINTHHTYH